MIISSKQFNSLVVKPLDNLTIVLKLYLIRFSEPVTDHRHSIFSSIIFVISVACCAEQRKSVDAISFLPWPHAMCIEWPFKSPDVNNAPLFRVLSNTQIPFLLNISVCGRQAAQTIQFKLQRPAQPWLLLELSSVSWRWKCFLRTYFAMFFSTF